MISAVSNLYVNSSVLQGQKQIYLYEYRSVLCEYRCMLCQVCLLIKIPHHFNQRTDSTQQRSMFAQNRPLIIHRSVRLSVYDSYHIQRVESYTERQNRPLIIYRSARAFVWIRIIHRESYSHELDVYSPNNDLHAQSKSKIMIWDIKHDTELTQKRHVFDVYSHKRDLQDFGMRHESNTNRSLFEMWFKRDLYPQKREMYSTYIPTKETSRILERDTRVIMTGLFLKCDSKETCEHEWLLPSRIWMLSS